MHEEGTVYARILEDSLDGPKWRLSLTVRSRRIPRRGGPEDHFVSAVLVEGAGRAASGRPRRNRRFRYYRDWWLLRAASSWRTPGPRGARGRRLRPWPVSGRRERMRAPPPRRRGPCQPGRGSSDFASRRMTAPSTPPVASIVPSGENDQATVPPCDPGHSSRVRPETASHRRGPATHLPRRRSGHRGRAPSRPSCAIPERAVYPYPSPRPRGRPRTRNASGDPLAAGRDHPARRSAAPSRGILGGDAGFPRPRRRSSRSCPRSRADRHRRQ